MEPSWYTSNLDTSKSFLLVVSVSLWLYWLWTRRHLYRFAFEFPGYLGTPLIGSFNRITGMKHLLPVFGRMFVECQRNTICIWMGLYPVLLTAEPEIVERVLSSPDLLNKAKAMYKPLQNVFGGGIVGSAVEDWHRNRKLINPSFAHKVLVSFLPVFHKGTKMALSKLDSFVGTGERRISEILQRVSLGISVETTMGKVMKEGDLVDEDLAEKYCFMMEKTSLQTLLSFLNLDGSFSMYNRFKQTKKYLHNFVNELIIKKLDRLTECMTNSKLEAENLSPEETVTIKKAPNIFIDQAIQLYQKQQLSWNDIIAESNTIVAASFETTANSIFSTIVMLAMHPEVQEKLYEEIVDVFPEKDFEMDYEHMNKLPYLDRVINETLRLTPSVPIIGRQVIKDTQLTKQVLLPRNLLVIISIFHLHRRTDIWGPNATRFDPDNFLPENLTDKHTYAFIPFSKGVRNCIGWRYALLTVKTMLCGLVRNFRFTTTFKFEDLQYVENIALKYLEEPGIEVHRR